MSRGTRRLIAAVLLILVLGLVLPTFISLNRYRSRVTEAISRALGRPVTASRIGLKLLPRPALVLSNFVVAEDPSYGAEPMLTAATVTASLRFSSLWRQRLEIGTLDLDTPSLNLVRRPDGHWNLEELVQRASQVASAPTTRKHPEARPRFPYVQASTGRINLKFGDVKKAFAFADADFALWQDTDNQWGIRLQAHPMRTDVNVTDTGTLKMDGQFQRATSLALTPVHLKLTFKDGPLGQLTKLIYGRDRGWRGDLTGSATLSGSPAALNVSLDLQADDFRRYDISLGEGLRLRTHCTGIYSAPDDSLRDVLCESPVGAGLLRIRGSASGWPGEAYDLDINAQQIPAERVVAFARHAKKDLPPDLTAVGQFDSVFTVRKQRAQAPVWAGGGQTSLLALHSGVLENDLDIGDLQFVIPAATTPAPAPKARPRATSKTAAVAVNPGLRLIVKPFALSLGAPSPATASAQFDIEAYTLKVSGPAELARLMNIAKALGVGTPGVGLAGAAQVDLDMAGTWVGFAPPVPSGKIQLHAVTAELQAITEPLQIASATATLDHQVVNLASFTAAFSQGPEITGSADFPVHCTTPENCQLHFDLHADDVSFARLNQLLNPRFRSTPWYHLLAIGQRHDDALLKLHADGNFSVARLELEAAVATNVRGTLDTNAGKLRITGFNADLLGGHHTGAWTADFTVSPPKYSGLGVLTAVSMAQLASLMHDNWAAGTANARYTLFLSGLSPDSLRASAVGSADFIWSGGALRHVSLDGPGTSMAFSNLAGKLSLQNGIFNLEDCKLQTGGNIYAVTGSASYDRSLDFHLQRADGRSYAISGTLEKPRVETLPATATRAALR
jgi:uncharacterized protein involved in outer membrane biogenesis